MARQPLGVTMWVDAEAVHTPRGSREMQATITHVRRELERCRRLIDQALGGLCERLGADQDQVAAPVAIGDDELFQVGPQGAD